MYRFLDTLSNLRDMHEIPIVTLFVVCIAALNFYMSPIVRERFDAGAGAGAADSVDADAGAADSVDGRDTYQKLYSDTKARFNAVASHVASAARDLASNDTPDDPRMDALEDRMDEAFFDLQAIDNAHRSKLDRLQFDESGSLLVCDVDGSNCDTLGPSRQ